MAQFTNASGAQLMFVRLCGQVTGTLFSEERQFRPLRVDACGRVTACSLSAAEQLWVRACALTDLSAPALEGRRAQPAGARLASTLLPMALASVPSPTSSLLCAYLAGLEAACAGVDAPAVGHASGRVPISEFAVGVLSVLSKEFA